MDIVEASSNAISLLVAEDVNHVSGLYHAANVIEGIMRRQKTEKDPTRIFLFIVHSSGIKNDGVSLIKRLLAIATGPFGPAHTGFPI